MRPLSTEFWFCLLALSLPASCAPAQTVIVSGSIRGTVFDASRAVVPAASIKAINRETRTEFASSGNRRGGYIFPSLPVGAYSVVIDKTGFNQVRVDGVVVQVGETATEDVELQVGAESQTIVVTSDELLRRESSISSIVNRSLLEGLPLSGRRYTDFAQLTPNTTPDGQTGLVSIGGEQGGEDTGYANGNGANSFAVDGASATSSYFGNARGGEKIPYTFGQNAILEFQITVSPYNAAYGGAATGFLNTVTRSGTDDFHGDAFYYNRNSATGANDAVSKAAGLARPLDILQQFGAAAGGPIKSGKLWFFFDYEQQRHKQPVSAINAGYAVDETAFNVPAGTPLPAPNGPLPIPGSDTVADPTDPVYLQQVANAVAALNANLGSHSRYANDLTLFNKYEYQATPGDRLYLSLNLNRFDSPNGEITATNTAKFGLSSLASAYVRDDQASSGWTHAFNPNTLSDLHLSFTRDKQYSAPAGILPAALPAIVFKTPSTSTFEIGNAGFANGQTDETQWQVAERVVSVHGSHVFAFGFETNQSHVTDVSFGGFDPDAARQNGTFAGTYGFSSFANFALGAYDSYSQSAGNPKFTFDVPYYAFYGQDTWQASSRLTVDFGLREDFQIYPRPLENPAFALTGQFPNEFKRFAPRAGFSYQAARAIMIRGGFGQFFENFNGLNYRNSVVSNGLATQQSSALTTVDPNLPLNAQTASVVGGVPYGPTFPNVISNDSSLFGASPNISLVSPNLKFPYVLQSSLEIETQIAPDTTLSVGAMWTRGVHLISGSAYDLNLVPPAGTTTYVFCPPGTTTPTCSGREVTGPNLDTGLLREGLITPNVGQINALISPGVNTYDSLFVQARRRPHNGLQYALSYTFAKNLTRHGVDFNNQFDFSDTSSPYLIDQRHHLSVAGVYLPRFDAASIPRWLRGAIDDWSLSTVMQFRSGRPYAALLDAGIPTAVNSAPNAVNDTAFNQATSNSALGIDGAAPVPGEGLNSFYGPWTEQVDLALGRSFHITERSAISLQAQALNLLNHANFYVQNGAGVNQNQYAPTGDTCGDGQTLNQTCYLVPETGSGGFGALQSINALAGPRVLQLALRYTF